MVMRNNRPTSPHLQIYKLPLTGIISISHRMTGVLLAAGLLLVVVMLTALAGGDGAYAAMQALTAAWPVKCLYWGGVFALFFHLCHGVRHLFWDAGMGFAKEVLDRYAKIELGMALGLTLLVAIFI